MQYPPIRIQIETINLIGISTESLKNLMVLVIIFLPNSAHQIIRTVNFYSANNQS